MPSTYSSSIITQHGSFFTIRSCNCSSQKGQTIFPKFLNASWISKSQTIIFYYIIFNFWYKTTALFLFQFLWMTLSFISRNSCSFTTTVITPILLMLFLELPSVCTCQRLLWILISININVDIDNWEVWLGTGRVHISPFLKIEQFVHHTSPRPP